MPRGNISRVKIKCLGVRYVEVKCVEIRCVEIGYPGIECIEISLINNLTKLNLKMQFFFSFFQIFFKFLSRNILLRDILSRNILSRGILS